MEKKSFSEDCERVLARDGPSHGTRSKSFFDKKSASWDTTAQPNIERLQAASNVPLKYSMTGRDSAAHMNITGCCDDDSEDSLVSPRIADFVVLKDIERLTVSIPVTVQVALCKNEDAQTFRSSRSWLVPGDMLHPARGQLIICNVSFFVADDDLACEDLLIGMPVLQRLCFDSKTPPESNLFELDSTNCADVGSSTTKLGYVERLMMARAMVIKLNAYKHGANSTQRSAHLSRDRPRVCYDEARKEPYPFPDPFLLDPADKSQARRNSCSC